MEYTVSGMSCAHCVSAVSEEVGAVPGVSSVVIDLDTKQVAVHGENLDDARSAPRSTRRATRQHDLGGRRDYRTRSPRRRGHDLRLVRGADREEAEPRSKASRQPVNFATEEATVVYDPAHVAIDDLRRKRSGSRLRRARSRRGRARGDVGALALVSWSLSPLTCPCAARDGAAAPVRRLGVGRARAGDAGRLLGRLAVPPGRVREPRHRAVTMDTLISSARSRRGAGRRRPRRPASTPRSTSRSRP